VTARFIFVLFYYLPDCSFLLILDCYILFLSKSFPSSTLKVFVSPLYCFTLLFLFSSTLTFANVLLYLSGIYDCMRYFGTSLSLFPLLSSFPSCILLCYRFNVTNFRFSTTTYSRISVRVTGCHAINCSGLLDDCSGKIAKRQSHIK
jgi:hypothetical protein